MSQKKIIVRVSGFVLLATFLLALFFFQPLTAPVHRGFPAENNFQIAEQSILETIATDAGIVSESCNSILMSHGNKTENAIIFLHGYTTCPGQFKELGELLYKEGYNVYIPRAPYHGLKDRLTDDIALLTMQEYTDYAERSVQVGKGLGQKITVAGLSGGGILTSWIALYDQDVKKAVIIAPAYGLAAFPQYVTLPAFHLYSLLPNSFRWWDETKKDADTIIATYPRYSTRSLAQVIGLGQITGQRLKTDTPAIKNIVMVKNMYDKSVSLPFIDEVVASLQKKTTVKLSEYVFPAEKKLEHDFIIPEFNAESKKESYEVLKTLIIQ